MFSTIAIGLGDAGGWRALARATEEAAATRAHLVVQHVCDPSSALARPAAGAPVARLELVDAALARAVGAVRNQLGRHRVTLRVDPGDPAVVLAGNATGADLLVVGSGGHGGTVRRIVGNAGCPVLVTRPSPAGATATFAGHVVVGVGGAGAGRAALDFGFGYAGAHRLPVAAVHVEGRAAARTAARELLSGEVEPWARKYPQTPVAQAVLPGTPVDALLRAGAGARLLVLGGQGHALGGNDVMTSVVDRAPCAVAVVGEEFLR